MILSFIYFLLTISFISDSTDLSNQTESQVIQYVDQIKRSEDIVYNLWALNEIASSHCSGLNLVKKHIGIIPEFSDYFLPYSCSELEKSNFDIQKFWTTEEQKLFNQITNPNISFSFDSLVYNENLLFHYNLLMSREVRTYYSTEILEDYLESWLSSKKALEPVDSIGYAVLLSNIIRAAYALDRFDIIIKNYSDFVSLEVLPNSLTKLRLLGSIDYTLYITGNYDKSLQVSRNHLEPLILYLDAHDMLSTIKLTQGASLYSLGKYKESKEVYENLYNNSATVDRQDVLFTNLGINYLKLGQSDKYITFQLRALNQEIEDYSNLLGIYRNLFIYYSSINDISTALNYIDKARGVAIENSDTTELALINSYLGSFYWENYKDADKALANLNAASGVLSPEKNYDTYIDLLIEKGTILSKIDSLESAQSIFNKIKELTLSRGDTPDYVDALINLTAIHLKQNELSKASENLEEIKLYDLNNIDFQLSTKHHTVKANYLSLIGNDREAIQDLLPVIDLVIERAKNNTDSQEGYWSVEEEYLDAFALIVELLIKNDRQNDALVILDRLKTINDASLYNSPLVKAAKLSEEELAEEKRLNDKLQSLRKEYLNASGENRFAIQTEIDRVSAVRNQILSPVNLTKEDPLPTIWSIQRSLSNSELLLHFTEVGSELYVSYLTSDNIRIKKFIFDKVRQEMFTEIGNELASGQTNLEDLFHLYETLELDDFPDHITQVSVIPDNYLYRIPLEVLPTKKPDSPISYGSSSYLIEDYNFRYFTSLREFESNRRSFRNTDATKNDFTGFAISDFKMFKGADLPSLPYATVETNNISNILSSLNNKKVYTGDAATKAIFKEKVGSSRLVHVATHSEVSEQDPLFSTIYLKNTAGNDTLQSDQALYAYELFDTPLNSEFIMLNSCSSGSGNYMQGTGIMGISRALRYAGAKSLALNLWSVNDKVASEFATDFYLYLNQGETKSEAIRMAKLNQLKKANANPHFWGAYMMIGNPSPITGKSTANSPLVFSLLLVTIFLTGFITYRKERE